MRLLARVILLVFLIAPALSAQDEITFGVLGLFHPRQLVLEPDDIQPLSIRAAEQDFTLNGEPGRSRLVLRAEGDKVIAHNLSASRFTVAARDGAPVRFRLSVPAKIHRFYIGKLTITAHGGVLTAIITMDCESAVASIVAAEMPADAPLEALKAQAVVTRSFLAAGPRHQEFDFCDTTHCQFLRSPDDVTPRTRQAVVATRGLVLAWHGQTIATLYSSRCGGQTHSLTDVGLHSRDGYPYYSVNCQWCRKHPIHWQSRLQTSISPPRPSNESLRIAYARQWGWSALPGSAFTETRDSDGVLIEGHSIGHSIGMCQFGAMGLAASGADFRSVLAHYYPNADVVLLRQ
jgi:peptidoglycan hydrolase-like amidase